MRVAVIGDDGVGKSTLITCLFRDRYVPNIEDVLPPLFFPRSNDSTIALVDTSPSLDKRKTLLSELRQANCIWLVYSDHYTMERVSLFWLPFLRNNGVNLPIILCQNKQDQLFKGDQGEEAGIVSVEEEEDVIQLMQDFKEIESFIRCSAKEKCNVNEAFYLCQRAIVYPLAPLFDSKVGHLKPLARQALSRIFFLYDEDQSGYLTTEKLQKLQQTVFQSKLDEDEIHLIQQTLLNIQEEHLETGNVSHAESREGSTAPENNNEGAVTENSKHIEPTESTEVPHAANIDSVDHDEQDVSSVQSDSTAVHINGHANGNTNGHINGHVDGHAIGPASGTERNDDRLILYDPAADGLTVDGFLTLAQLYCERGRHETIWEILRHFQYTDSLSLDDKFLRPTLNVDMQSHVELSPNGYQFLVDLFTLFDMDNDGGLSPEELKALFTPTPGLPTLWRDVNFPYSTLRNDDGYVTLQGWLAQWSMFVYLDHTDALAYIAMLGYNSRADHPDVKSALRVTKPAKKRNPRSNVYRNYKVQDRQVFNCLVFGAAGAGKSTLLSSFLGSRSRSDDESNPNAPQTVVNSVEMPGGKQCYLIMQECGSLEETLLKMPHKLDECDVVCLAYDSSDPDSFNHVVELRKRHRELDDLPLVFAALKADQDRAQQRCDEQPDEYTTALGIAAPMHVSSNWPSSLSALFVQIVDAAMHPGSATIVFPREETEESMILELSIGAGITSVIALAWWWASYRNRSA